MTTALRETETAFLGWVLDAAKLYGWKTFHARPAWTANGMRTAVQGDGKGWPDVCMAHPKHGLIFAELKAQDGCLSPEQAKWLEALSDAGAEVHLWRPADREDILRRLQGGAW